MADDHEFRDDLYARDFYAWTQTQAEALRARRSGRNALDYDHLAEEIEDVGSEVLHACESFVERIIEHLLKIEFAATAETIPHWRGELRSFRRDLNKRLTPTLRNKLQSGLDDAFAEQVKDLAVREILSIEQTAEAKFKPYAWDQIVDPDWYPEPRYP